MEVFSLSFLFFPPVLTTEFWSAMPRRTLNLPTGEVSAVAAFNPPSVAARLGPYLAGSAVYPKAGDAGFDGARAMLTLDLFATNESEHLPEPKSASRPAPVSHARSNSSLDEERFLVADGVPLPRSPHTSPRSSLPVSASWAGDMFAATDRSWLRGTRSQGATSRRLVPPVAIPCSVR